MYRRYVLKLAAKPQATFKNHLGRHRPKEDICVDVSCHYLAIIPPPTLPHPTGFPKGAKQVATRSVDASMKSYSSSQSSPASRHKHAITDSLVVLRARHWDSLFLRVTLFSPHPLYRGFARDVTRHTVAATPASLSTDSQALCTALKVSPADFTSTTCTSHPSPLLPFQPSPNSLPFHSVPCPYFLGAGRPFGLQSTKSGNP